MAGVIMDASLHDFTPCLEHPNTESQSQTKHWAWHHRTKRYDIDVLFIAADKDRELHWIQLDFDSDDTHILHLSHWLDICSLVSLDAAVTNHACRAYWTTLLRTMRSAAVDDWGHSYSSLMWLIRRGIRPTRMHLTADAWQVHDCDL
jgi:hypothetical protein